MNEVIYRGLLISTSCKYFLVHEGKLNSLKENKNKSTLEITYAPGSTSLSLSVALGLLRLGKDMEMISMPTILKIPNVIVSINCLLFKKLTYDTHTINILIVSDSDSRVLLTYDHTTIIVSPEDSRNPEFIKFLFYSGNLKYIRPIGPKAKEDYVIYNFPKITLKDKNLTLESTSETIYSLRSRYNDYVIRAIDYQDLAILEIRKILEDYGIELVRWNKELTLRKTSYVTYLFSLTPTKFHHPDYADGADKVISLRLPIDFTLRCTDMVMFFDFKNKYNNVDLLTNFCEFRTMDKYGQKWTAAIKWDRITEEFNHIYLVDDNSNFSYLCLFRAELYFYEVIDDRYEFIKEINYNLESDSAL